MASGSFKKGVPAVIFDPNVKCAAAFALIGLHDSMNSYTSIFSVHSIDLKISMDEHNFEGAFDVKPVTIGQLLGSNHPQAKLKLMLFVAPMSKDFLDTVKRSNRMIIGVDREVLRFSSSGSSKAIDKARAECAKY
jgi:hypothetical protein